MIIITGATGALGSRIVDRLLTRLPAETLGVSVTDPDRAADLAARGVRVRHGDFTDPDSLDKAFEGADRLLIVSAAIRGPGAARASRAAIDAAVRAGASRILYTSHQAASPSSLFAAQPQHAATEAYLAEQGVPFTALRNGFYASTIDAYLDAALAAGAFRLPVDGPVSWTAHDDLADAAAALLTADAVPDGPTAPLTAARALDFTAIAEIVSDLTGRSIGREVVDDDEWAAGLLASGMPESALGYTLGLFTASRRGEFDVVDPALGRLIGRPPIPLREEIERMLARRG